MTEDQIASIQYAADWLSRSEDIGNRKHGERLRALLSASIADTAGANCATCGAVGTVTSTKARCTLCGMFADTAGAKPVSIEQERERFEAMFQMPAQCVRYGDSYTATDYNAWEADDYKKLWKGWQARAAIAAPPAPPAPSVADEMARSGFMSRFANEAPSVADAKCMCSGLGPCEKLSNCRKAPSVADAAGASEIRALIADDAYAMSFQTMGQYRSALLNAIKKESGK